MRSLAAMAFFSALSFTALAAETPPSSPIPPTEELLTLEESQLIFGQEITAELLSAQEMTTTVGASECEWYYDGAGNRFWYIHESCPIF